MATIGEALSLALQRHQAGDLAGAESIFRQVLAVDPVQPEALHYLGLIAFQVGRSEAAIDLMRRSLAVAPLNERAHCNLGVAFQSISRLEEAAACYRQALQLQPNYPEALSNLGYALTELGKPEEAVVYCQRALALRPDYALAYTNLAVALQALGRLDDAAACCKEAIRFRPDLVEAHNTLGTIQFLQDKNEHAQRSFREALRLRPGDPKAHCNLAAVLLREGKLDESEIELRRALAQGADYPAAWLNLGGVLLQRGQVREAADCYRAAVSAGLPGAGSNLLLCLNYDSELSNESLFEEHRAWGAGHAGAVPSATNTGRDRNPDRPLRIGYVSPDLRAHTVAAFLRPILANHNRTQIDAICYAHVSAPDVMTSKLMSFAAGWRNIHGLNDNQAAELIHSDRIDILVDLAGHTADNRLHLFALRPAPIQVSYLGYPCTTGLAAIDYYLTDSVCDPPDEPLMYTEKVYRLPRGFCCYDPPSLVDSPGPSPVEANGIITFGSFHHLAKLNDRVLDLWAAILRNVPRARLLVLRHTLQGAVRELLLGRLSLRGVEPDRLEMMHAPPAGKTHLDMYAKVDISLDAFPWSGHTTACESLWMGVPVITLRGSRHAGRMVASVLSLVGLPELIADSPEHYCEIAVKLANDTLRLRNLRTSLREKVRTSALCDSKAFTRELEAAFRDMWRKYVAGV